MRVEGEVHSRKLHGICVNARCALSAAVHVSLRPAGIYCALYSIVPVKTYVRMSLGNWSSSTENYDASDPLDRNRRESRVTLRRFSV